MSRLRIVLIVLWCVGFGTGPSARADVSGEIARIEKLPRPERFAAYEMLANRGRSRKRIVRRSSGRSPDMRRKSHPPSARAATGSTPGAGS